MRKRKLTANAGAEGDTAVQDRQFVTALDRGLDILRAFRPDDHAGLSNRELSERTGMPTSTLSRLTYTLLQSGYLLYDRATGRYRMGVPVLSLGYACLSGQPIRAMAQGYMQQLAEECGQGVQVGLGGRIDFTMIYLATARSRSVVSLQLDVGSRVSLARTAMGRAYVAGCPEDERAAILDSIHQHFPAQEAGRREGDILRAVDQLENQGFCTNYGDWLPGVNSVGVPFRPGNATSPQLAFSIGGPAIHVSPDQLQSDFGPRLVELVETLQQGVI
ncbi:IclR family transcriptional regulator [Marinibacterium sp. SX1]|uniref:IclR family transcriptional regulator n=1 Tax=Marinibacterium sp. SX1 TaxID=3388424 RepID=UPI003D17CDB8